MTGCPICGTTAATLWARATDEEYRSVATIFDFWRCESCGAVRIDPVPADRLPSIYPPNYYSYQEIDHSFVWGVKNWLDQRFLRAIANDIPGNALAALDVGGGTGAVIGALRRADPRFIRTTVVDIDVSARASAETAGHEFVCSRIEDYAASSEFDLILMMNLIEHVADPISILRAARNMLKPAGRIVVKTPNIDCLDARLFRSNYWGGLHAPRHWVLFDRKSFTMAADAGGLSIKRFSYTQGGAFWAYSLLAWARRCGMVSVSAQRPMVQHPLFAPLGGGFAVFDFVRLPVSRPSQMFAILAHAEALHCP
jgi:SAM-dependent methyltransferase